MKVKLSPVLIVAGAVLLALGCVERKMLIRSEPPNAPVWLDEQHIGFTPLDHPFEFYGAHRIRVGPIRDERERVQYGEVERIVEIEAPWFETFPIDFFFEVLYPAMLSDVHQLPAFKLPRSEQTAHPSSEERVREVREQAEQFRKKALYTIPEQTPGG